jgi:hypothetical protein
VVANGADEDLTQIRILKLPVKGANVPWHRE